MSTIKENRILIVSVAVGLTIIFSWMFFAIPQLKSNDDMWNVHIQSFGLYQSINSVGEKLSEPANIIFNYQRQAVGYNGNEIELLTKYEYIDYDSKETIWNLEFSEFADKLSRKYLDKEGFVMFPQDLQKQNYHVFDIGSRSALLMEFQGTEFFKGIEVYRFSGDIEFDISENYPEIEMPVYEQYSMTTFVEPQTGLEVSYEENFTDFVIVDNEKIPILVVSDETSDFSKDILVDSVKRQKKLFFIYEYIVTSFILLGISSTIFTIFYKQQSKKKELQVQKEKISSFEKLMEVKRKKDEDVLYDTIPNPVVTFDKNNKLVDCNQYFLKTMGYSKDEILELYAPDFLTEESKKVFHDVIFPSLKSGKQLKDIELRIKKKDGDFFHSLWSHITLRDENNEYLGFTAIGLDLTEIDKLKDALIKSEKFKALGELSGNLAHDIRNPLSVIKNAFEIIERRPSTEILLKEGPRIKRGITRISHQVNDVLQFVGYSPLQIDQNSLLEIMKSSINSLEIPDSIQITLPKNDVIVDCDEFKIQNLFTNIFLNAIQAIKDKGEINIKVFSNQDEVSIEIQNSGEVIPEEVLPRIFEPLFTTKMEGTGLGLASCKSIIEQHDGTIHVRNNPVTFSIKLPKIIKKEDSFESMKTQKMTNDDSKNV